MKNTLFTFFCFVLLCSFLSGCSKKNIFSGTQEYRISEEQISELSNADVPVDVLRNIRVDAKDNTLVIEVDNRQYRFAVIRFPPPPPQPCQCRPETLILNFNQNNQILAESDRFGQPYVFEASQESADFFRMMESFRINKLSLVNQTGAGR